MKIMHPIHVRCISFTLNVIVLMNNIQFKHNYQIIGDKLSPSKVFCWNFIESSICALFNQLAAFFIACRQSPGVSCKLAQPALEKALKYPKIWIYKDLPFRNKYNDN